MLSPTPTVTARGIESTRVAAKVPRMDQRAAPPVRQIERASRRSMALRPAMIMSAASTAIGTRPTSSGTSRTSASIQPPAKTADQRLRAPALRLSAV